MPEHSAHRTGPVKTHNVSAWTQATDGNHFVVNQTDFVCKTLQAIFRKAKTG